MNGAWRLEQPWWLLLLLGVVALWLWRPRRGGAAFGPYLLLTASLPRSRGPALWRTVVAGGLACLSLAMARPQWGRSYEVNETEGRDLVLVIDLSFSMITDDMYDEDGRIIDRLAAVTTAAQRFVERRPNDRIGLVFFAERAETYCPLTVDHDFVARMLEEVEQTQRSRWQAGLRRGNISDTGLLGNGTNLGLGIGTAVAGLLAETEEAEPQPGAAREPPGRAVVLITDGRDTSQQQMPLWVDPVQAARHAETLDVSLYCIGVGDDDGRMTNFAGMNRRYRPGARIPVEQTFLPDMDRLHEIAAAADGLASHATDREELAAIFDRIDALEPSPFEVEEVHDYADRFQWPLLTGLALLLLAMVVEPRLRGPLS